MRNWEIRYRLEPVGRKYFLEESKQNINMRQIQSSMQRCQVQLDERGVSLAATEQSINTKTPEGKCFLNMLSVFFQN